MQHLIKYRSGRAREFVLLAGLVSLDAELTSCRIACSGGRQGCAAMRRKMQMLSGRLLGFVCSDPNNSSVHRWILRQMKRIRRNDRVFGLDLGRRYSEGIGTVEKGSGDRGCLLGFCYVRWRNLVDGATEHDIQQSRDTRGPRLPGSILLGNFSISHQLIYGYQNLCKMTDNQLTHSVTLPLLFVLSPSLTPQFDVCSVSFS